MRKIKLIMQIVAAFIVAMFAYNLFYEPNRADVRAAVRGSLPRWEQAVGSAAGQSSPDGKLRVTVLDVGQGDAILLQDGKRNVMIDVGDVRQDETGGGRPALERALAKAGLKAGTDKINTVIVTHHHGDHMGNIQWLAGKYNISNIYDNAAPNEKNKISQWLNRELRAGHYHNRVLKAGDKVQLGEGYYLDVLSPGDFIPAKALKNINNTSIVMKLHYGEFTMLLTGDAEAPVEDELQKLYGDKLQADVLKVGHHGSRTSSIYKFVSRVKPKYALISCGSPKIYNHPNKDVVGRLQHLGAQVLTTFEHGSLTVTTDGKTFDVQAER